MSVAMIYPEPGPCPECGTELHEVLVDPPTTGLSWMCAKCGAPKHVTDWTRQLYKTRMERRVSLANLAQYLKQFPLISVSTARLSAIETGHIPPKPHEVHALNKWINKEREQR